MESIIISHSSSGIPNSLDFRRTTSFFLSVSSPPKRQSLMKSDKTFPYPQKQILLLAVQEFFGLCDIDSSLSSGQYLPPSLMVYNLKRSMNILGIENMIKKIKNWKPNYKEIVWLYINWQKLINFKVL